MLGSPRVVESTSRLGLLRRSPSFGYLFLATAGSSFGTYLAAIALVLQIGDLTGSGVWVAALLIADFLPIVLIGFLLGPLVDRLSRRRLMVASDLVRFGVFAALPFVNSPEGLVVLAGVTGVATGFFFPAANAAIPNLVPEKELPNANSLTVTIDTLAMTLGPLVGAVLYAAWGPSVPYAVNAVTFLRLRGTRPSNPGDEPPLRGPAHARPLARRCGRIEARRHLPTPAHGADRRALGLGDLLDRMPAGLFQMVGETGWQLSHGERSRLFMARALLQGADLTILDESLGALDPETLSECLRCALTRVPTLMVIAHP